MQVQKQITVKGGYPVAWQAWSTTLVEREAPADGIHDEDVEQLVEQLRAEDEHDGQFKIAYVVNGETVAEEILIWDAADDALQTHLGIHG